MNVLDLLSQLRRAGIQLSLDGDKLKIKAPPGALTDDLKTQLKDQKEAIIDFLRESQTVQGDDFPVIDRNGPLPLSYTQLALWTMDKLNPGSIAYNLPMAFRFTGALDVALLNRAISEILQRHEALRCVMQEDTDGQPSVRIRAPAPYDIPRHHLELDTADEVTARIRTAVYALTQTGFNLAEGPLYRFDLIRLSGPGAGDKPGFVLAICIHHIIADGLSLNLLIRELALLYASYLKGVPAPLAPLPVQYVDFAHWQRQRFSGELLQKEIRFWREQLQGVPSLLALPTDRPRPPIQTTRGTKFHFQLDDSLSVPLGAWCQSQGLTLFMGLMAGLQVVLSRHANQYDFCIGMPIAGRNQKAVEPLIGFFVNGVLVRADLNGNPTWSEHVGRVKQRLLDVFAHQDTPAQLIIDHLDVRRHPSYPPLAQVGFQLQNFAAAVQGGEQDTALLDSFRQMTDLTMEPLRLEEAESKFDMIISAVQNGASLAGYVEYNTDLFDESTIARIVRHWQTALRSLLSGADERIGHLMLDTPAELAAHLGVQAQEQLLPLTATQLAFVQDMQLRPHTRQYAIGYRYALHFDLDSEQMAQAIRDVNRQTAAVRARFVLCDLPWAESCYQILGQDDPVLIETLELPPQDDPTAYVEAYFERWCYREHDIFNEPLVRWQIVSAGPQRHWLLFSTHHIILDGIGGISYLQKILHAYEARMAGETWTTTDGYADYIQENRREMDTPDTLAYWRAQGADVVPVDFALPKAWQQNSEYQIQTQRLGKPLWTRVREFCRKQKTHPSIFLRLLSALLLKQYCRPEGNFVINDIQAGRKPGQETDVGVYYQQVPYIIDLATLGDDRTVKDFFSHQRDYRRAIRDVQSISLTAQNHLLPVGRIAFQFNYFNFLSEMSVCGHRAVPYTFSSHVENVVQIFVKDFGDDAAVELWFDGNVFVPLHFIDRVALLAEQFTARDGVLFGELSYCLPAEQAALNRWNATADPAALQPASIVQAFEQVVPRFARQPAVIHRDITLSYDQLNRSANRLARHLHACGLQRGERVGICLSRSPHLLVSVWAVLKAGATYIPIEAGYPCERIQYILQDSSARILLSESCVAERIGPFAGQTLLLDQISAALALHDDTDLPEKPRADDGIYIIYTSGSTGQPKGAALHHAGEVNLQHWYTRACGFGPADRSLIVSAFGFDLTQKNLFAPLLCGGAVVIPPMDEYDAEIVAAEIVRTGVTHINCAPSAFYALAENPDDTRLRQLQTLRWVYLGGEPIRMNALQSWLQHPSCRAQVVNSYGPTECTDVVSWQVIDDLSPALASIPIGRPVCNTEIHILNDALHPAPHGVPGEICIGGVGVGRGYLNRDELTAQVFVDNPFGTGRLYRTGDLGRFLPDGRIEYIGRKDFQVKVRGLRIELGEIEHAIKQLPTLVDALVQVKQDRLIAYAVSTDPATPPDWQTALRHSLPDYMVPARLILLPAWPLTPNGKIDRKALPDPDLQQRSVPYVAPRDDIEIAIADVWSQLLKKDDVSIHDSFFDLGGHSLLANQIVSRLRKHFAIALPIRDLMIHPTVAELAQRVRQAQRNQQLAALEPCDRRQRIPLSIPQQRLWLLDRIEPGNPAYHVPSIVRIDGALDVAVLEQAFATVVNRHEGLRVIFAEDGQGPHQIIQPEDRWTLEHRRVAADVDEEKLRRQVAARVMQPFDLARGPLFRATVFERDAQQFILVVVLHHIVTDGWSNGILVRELAQAYAFLKSGLRVQFAPLPLQYADFAAWQRAQVSEETLAQKMAFWHAQLENVPALELPTDLRRPALQTFRGASVRLELSADTAEKLQRLANETQSTAFMVLLAAYAGLLQKYSGQDDFCIGTPVAGRDRPELENIVGFFVNTLALRVQPQPTLSFRQVLEAVRERALSGFEQQDVPFEQLVEALNPVRDMSRSPLFQVMLVYQNIPQDNDTGLSQSQVGDIRLSPFRLDIETAKFEQTLTLWPQQNRIAGSLTYNTDLFSAETARRFVRHFEQLCASIAENPDAPLHELRVLDKAEICTQLQEWNLTARDYDKTLSLSHWFDQTARQQPDHVAIVCGSEQLTYAQLQQHTHRFAHYLIQQGVKPGDRVAVCLDRHLHLMTAILGVIGAGATYVPLDASYPEERLRYILDNAGISVGITRSHLTANLPARVQWIHWDESRDAIAQQPAATPSVPHDPERLLYVIFTSGSTGKPKGTSVHHRSEINLLDWYINQFGMQPSDRFLLLSAIGFDLTQKSLFGPLMCGATLVIPDFQEYDSSALQQLIGREKITWINCAPSAFYPLQDERFQWEDLQTLRYLFLGGEPINLPRLADWLRQSRCQLVNSYGPTECTDIAAWYAIDVERDISASALPIGRPNFNVRLYVLGKQQELLPIGAIGELYISGEGVGPGYLNNAELTAQVFLPNPYLPDDRIYCTGDRVRYRPDGVIEYLGRRDHQMKLRGYRIEAGEIQAVINQMPGVKDSVVDILTDDSGVQRLVAWVMTDPAAEQPVTPGQLSQRVLAFLPAFMVPENWVVLATFPLTPNGKVDRKALPKPTLDSDRHYVAPRTALESRLASLWAGVLGRERIGVHDNFFQSGGQSLLATQLVSRISRQLNRNISVRALFENPTLERFARLIEQTDAAPSRPVITPRPERQQARLSFGQQRLWFFEQLNPGTSTNNMPMALKIRGPLHEEALQHAFRELVRRHESLRTQFETGSDGEPVQRILPQVDWHLSVQDLSNETAARRDHGLQQQIEHNRASLFDLTRAPLLRATLVKTAATPEYHLLFCMHHIVSDGASLIVLFRELVTLYLAFSRDMPSPLPELRLHYGDFAEWQREWLSDDRLNDQLHYWQNKLAKAPPLLELPLDQPRPPVQTTTGASRPVSFPATFGAHLKTFCTDNSITPFMFLLTAWKLLLARHAGQHDILVGVPTLGRHAPELENLIGFFIQSLVLRTDLGGNPTVTQAVQRVRQTVLDGFSHIDVPVDLIVERLGVRRNPAYSPLVQVAFQLRDNAAFNTDSLLQSSAFGDLQVEMLGGNTTTAKFDLTLNLTQHDEQFAGSLEYNSTLFFAGTVQRLLQQYVHLCECLLQSPQQPVDSLPLTAAENLLTELELDAQVYETVLPLTAMQTDMFMDNLVNPDSLQSSHGWHIHIHQELDVALWRDCVQTLSDHQPLMRARFVTADKPWLDMGYLAVRREHAIPFEWIDLSGSSISENELQMKIRNLIYHPYDLARDELVTYQVLKLAPAHFVVVTAVHHAVLDGAALNSLWQQITACYQLKQQGRAEECRHAPAVFNEYVQHDRTHMNTADVLAFWRERFRNVEPLDFTVPAPVPAPAHFLTRERFLDDAHWQQLKKFCREHRITPALYLKCLFGLMIKTYCRPDADFSIQETMGGRIKGHYDTMGCYIQEIPFVFSRDALKAEATFAELLEHARQFQKDIKDQRLISIGQQIALSPRGRVGFMFNYYQFLAHTEFLGDVFHPEGTPSDPANNVQFVVTEVAGKLKFNLFYHAHLFADFGFLERIEALSQQIVFAGVQSLGELQYVTDPAEKRLLTEIWNDTAMTFDLGLCLHQKVEQQAQQHPARVAILDDQVQYTYQQLNQRANQLAHHLQRLGVQRHYLVGLCAERSADFLVGILGIMKAGAAYVPMDPKYPQDRIAYMIENSEVSILLTQEPLLEKIGSHHQAQPVCLDRDWPLIAQESAADLHLKTSPRDRAYMLYTSGSTGLPKGALIRHDGALNHIEAERKALEFSADFSFLQTAPASSDISVWQFIGPVTCGGKVVVLDDVTHSRKLFERVKQHDISVVELVPVALQLLMEYVRTLSPEQRALPSLRWMMATGEAVSVDLVNDWLALYPQIPVVNAYGPTEAADDVIQAAIHAPLPADRKSVPIGKPLANLDVFIVDDQMRLVPPGVPGEICIGGIGVGEGYWKNPEKTAQAFVPNPFPGSKGGMLYRTGDLGRWLSDGTAEYLDRVDNQVKVRGFRIELGEVESAVSALPGVRENVVIVRHDMPGGTALAAYVVATEEAGTLEPTALRAQLRERLPDFMVPAAITVLEKMPLTPAGKIDRKALPRPDSIQLGGADYVAPRTELETQLATIWEAFLPVERVGIRDNFFELGGHSLIGVRIMARINKERGTHLQVAALLTAQTIEKLAQRIGQGNDDQETLLVPLAESTQPPLFLIHPVGGDVLCYVDLARALQNDFRLYGVRARGLSGTGAPITDQNEWVQHSVALIRTAQPHGPYRLGGQSLGGILALAVAHALEAQGETVSHVILLDTFSPAHLRATFQQETQLLGAALGRTLPTVAETENTVNADGLYRAALASGALPADFPRAQFDALHRVAVSTHRLASQYAVERVQANVHHFTARDNRTGIASGNTWQGEALTLHRHEVPGGHETLMQGDNAPALARQLAAILKTDNKNSE